MVQGKAHAPCAPMLDPPMQSRPAPLYNTQTSLFRYPNMDSLAKGVWLIEVAL